MELLYTQCHLPPPLTKLLYLGITGIFSFASTSSHCRKTPEPRMFKFNFCPNAAVEEDHQPTSSPDSGAIFARSATHAARQIEPTSSIGATMATGVEAHVAWRSGNITLFRTVPNVQACPEIPEESDLVQGVYEGGLKVWEASVDLVEYLATLGIGETERCMDDKAANVASSKAGETESPCPTGRDGAHARAGYEKPSGECAEKRGDRQPGTDASRVKGRLERVLELGCGHGLPGIMALRQGLHVCFSDFNSEVIEQVTVPNVRLNVPDSYWDRAEYYSGDWSSLSPLLDKKEGGGRFDLILTAETLYTTAVADKVLEMILRHLARDGQALVASKRFYFGTGGSTQYFCQQAMLDGRLACVDVTVVNNGKGNIREVMRVSWREGRGPLEEVARCHNNTTK